MIDFGYNISTDNQIDYDSNNKSVAAYIRLKEPTFDLCIACGSCAATCSAANKTEFSLRKINILVKRGELSDVEEEIKKCMFCGKCMLVCPRGVNTRKLILVITRAMEKYNINAL
jgi:heterodisulfide reductase subunit C